MEATMENKETGGSAFPGTIPQFSYQHPEPGMTLRDWFAGQALAGMATLYAVAGGASEDIAKANATVSYLMADAMIAERNKP